MSNPANLVHIALVADTPELAPAELTGVVAALQVQVLRDLAPAWGVSAVVSPCVRLDDVPLDAWPVIVRGNLKAEDAGIRQDRTGQPYAVVAHGPTWSIAASHACLEMIVDPAGSRLHSGPSLKRGQGLVSYLVAVCDPCQAPEFGYVIEGVLVSDFFTPHFFDATTVAGVSYDHTGAIVGPRSVLKGGQLTWHDPVGGHWWQESWLEERREIHELGALPSTSQPPRTATDRLTLRPTLSAGVAPGADPRLLAAAGPEALAQARAARASEWGMGDGG